MSNLYSLNIGDRVSVTLTNGQTYTMTVSQVGEPGTMGTRVSEGPYVVAHIRPGGYSVRLGAPDVAHWEALPAESDAEPTYAERVTRTLTDFHHWGHMGMSGVEFTVTYGYPDAPDEVRYQRIARNTENVWTLYTLDGPHGHVDESAPFPRLEIALPVIQRMLNAPGAIVSGAPTRAFVEAFYA